MEFKIKINNTFLSTEHRENLVTIQDLKRLSSDYGAPLNIDFNTNTILIDLEA